MTFTWHSITKNIHAENLGLKFNRRLDKIKTQLQHFPENSVHLHIALEKNVKKDDYVASLTLRLPSNILRAHKSAGNMMTAFDKAADALLREIASLKADLRGDYKWENRGRRARLHEDKLTRFGVLPMGEDIPAPAATGGEMLEEHRRRLLSYVQRQIAFDEARRRIPANLIDANSVVEEVIRLALEKADEKPPELTHKVWFYVLAREELERRYSAFSMMEREASEVNGGMERAEMLHRKFEPPVSEPLEVYVDGLSAESQTRLLELLQIDSAHWTDEERAVFDLRFYEGLEPDEIAVITGQEMARISEVVDITGDRIRELRDRSLQPELEKVGA